jgi:antitoxin ParD1/3/4
MNLNVSLTEHLVDYIKTKVSTGRYASSSEVVREALRLLEQADQHEAERLERLRAAWRDGVESGDAGELDFAVLKQEGRARLAASKV